MELCECRDFDGMANSFEVDIIAQVTSYSSILQSFVGNILHHHKPQSVPFLDAWIQLSILQLCEALRCPIVLITAQHLHLF
jgi:hypothetical protein